MDFAITFNPDAPLPVLVAAVKLAEELGYSDAYVADQGFSRDIYVTLATLAVGTQRMHLGPGITHPYTRHPATTAVAIASLDELSGGRAFLGLGAGGFLTLDALCIPQDKPLQSCREAIEIARLLWQGGRVSYEGSVFKLNHAGLKFACRRDIPIHWAARGPKMLALGGELADSIMLHGIPRFEVGPTLAEIAVGEQKAGRKVRKHFAFAIVYDEASRQAARMRTGYRLVAAVKRVQERLGFDPELIQRMRDEIGRDGAQAGARYVTDEVMSHFVVECDLESGRDQLRALVAEHGLDGLTVEIPDPSKAGEVLPRAKTLLASL